MINKQKSLSINAKLKKYSSHSKFKYIHEHSLNKSPTKNVPSFKTGSLRFLKTQSMSPDKFYDIKEIRNKKSTSFGFGIKTNFAKKQFVPPTQYNADESFRLTNLNKMKGPSFGISRQDFYRGKSDKLTQKVGPGIYNLKQFQKKNSFYIGMKIEQKNETVSPGPGAYNIRQNQIFKTRSSTLLKIKIPRIKTQHFEKRYLQTHDNQIPGPGSYNLNLSSTFIDRIRSSRSKPKLPQCPRFKVTKQLTPCPGAQQSFRQISEPFSEFG